MAVLSLSSPVLAQIPGVEPGVIEKQFEKPRTPEPQKPTELPAPLVPSAPKNADKVSLHLTSLSFEGATVFSQAKLETFAKDLIGHDIKVSDLFVLSQTITKAYSDAGYPLAVALVPKQDVTAGHARILIFEGYIAEIEIAGEPGKARARLEALGERLKAERPLTQKALERYLLLANELPGLDVRAVLDKASAPDKAPGSVKLILNAAQKPYEASLEIDNRGSRALGRERGIVSLQENGRLFGTETISLGLAQTFQTRELTYVHTEIADVLNAEGTEGTLRGTWSRSEPDTPLLRSVDFNSNGWTAAFELSHPLIRSRARTLRIFAGFEMKDLSSDFEAITNSHDKLTILRQGARYDFGDRLGGVTQADVTVSEGVALFNATREADADKSHGNGSGQFASVTLTLGHLQPLTRALDLWVSASGQLASRGLLASEQCGYGGSDVGKGFDSYEIAGDACVVGTAELRYAIETPGIRWMKLQPFAFYDAGLVHQRGTLLAGEPREETGQSLGAGLRFQLGTHVGGSIEYDQPLARKVALQGNKDGRVFFTLSVSI